MSAKQGVFVPVSVDSYGDIPGRCLVERIVGMAGWSREEFEGRKGMEVELFRPKLELETSLKWRIFPRDSEHPTSALNAVYRHMKTLQLHRDRLTSLGL